MPFENTSDHPEYNWIGESFADSLSVLLDKPGLIVVTSDERAVAYQRLRLPLTVIPSRATAIKIARELKASMIVFGTYNVTASPAASGDDKSKPADKPAATIIGQARVIRVNEGRMAGDISTAPGRPGNTISPTTSRTCRRSTASLAYQILFQRDKALSFSRNNLIQEATKVPPQAFRSVHEGIANRPKRTDAGHLFQERAKALWRCERRRRLSASGFRVGTLLFQSVSVEGSYRIFHNAAEKGAALQRSAVLCRARLLEDGRRRARPATLVPLADEKVMPLVAVYNNAGAFSVEAARNEKKPEERTRLLLQGITLLSRAADSSPDDTTVLFNYGYALFLNEKFGEAADKLERVIATDQRDGQAYYLLAKAQARANHADAAPPQTIRRAGTLQSYAKWETDWQKSQAVMNLNLRSRDVLNQVDTY